MKERAQGCVTILYICEITPPPSYAHSLSSTVLHHLDPCAVKNVSILKAADMDHFVANHSKKKKNPNTSKSRLCGT